VTQNPSQPEKLFVHARMEGGMLQDLQYLVKQSSDGGTWTVFLPSQSMSGGTEYGRRIGVIDKPSDVSVGTCNCE
jgi:hypothetical protein